MKKNSRGFSLIELLIVVAIILIIAAIAIPDLLKSRQAANQASAVGSLRTINTSEVTYSSTYTFGFSSDLLSLDGTVNPSVSTAAGLLDSVLAAGLKSGYTFIYVACPAVPVAAIAVGTVPPGPGPGACVGKVPLRIDSYEMAANPTNGAGNGNFYFTDQSGVIRMNNTVPALTTDPPLAG